MQNEVDCNSPESRKAVFRKLVDLYAAGDVSALDQVIPADYVGHTSAGDRNREEFVKVSCFFTTCISIPKTRFASKIS